MPNLRFGSVCSGIEAASVAWNPLGWEAAWFSEIEAFPSAVLAHHYPDVPNLGDMTTLPKRIGLDGVEAPDVLCGGTPCQAFSVAGLRQSLDDSRGNLSLTFCEIADAIDDFRRVRGDRPAIIFWENVPGVLGTKDNAFGCFLAGLAGEDQPLEPTRKKWTNAGYVLGPKRAVAWRTLDAQYFGLAQRRRRVFVVASARDDFDPAKVLLEFDSLRRDIAPSRQARQASAACARSGTKASGSWWDGGDLAATMTTKSDDQRMPDKDNAQLVLSPTMQVRRLTPVECERLQGFQDNYTAIPWRNKPADQCPDGLRYRALGNSWAVPVVHWIGKRIELALQQSYSGKRHE